MVKRDGWVNEVAAQRPKARQSAILVRPGESAVPDKVGGTGTNPSGGRGGVLKSVGDQISSNISTVTGGLTGGNKADNADGSKADNSDGSHRADNAGGRHRADNAGGRHQAR